MRIARDLKRLLEILKIRIERLSNIVSLGITSCIALEVNFEQVNQLRQDNQKGVNEDRERFQIEKIAAELDEANRILVVRWLRYVFLSEADQKKEEMEKQVSWNMDARHLGDIRALHSIAYDSFSMARKVLDHGRLNMDTALESVTYFTAKANQDWGN